MNGKNEELTFTREDSDRLVRIETKLDALNGLKAKVIKNATWIKALRYVVGGSGFGLILVILRVFGVL